MEGSRTELATPAPRLGLESRTELLTGPTDRYSRATIEAWWYEIKSDEIKKALREVKGSPQVSKEKFSKEKFRWSVNFKPNRHGIWEQRSGHDLISAFWKLDPAVAAKLSMAQTEKASS